MNFVAVYYFAHVIVSNLVQLTLLCSISFFYRVLHILILGTLIARIIKIGAFGSSVFRRFVLGMLDSWHEWVLFIIHVLVSMHVIIIHSLLNTGHVAIHFEIVLDIDLLVKHLFVGKLVVFLIPCMLIINYSILISLRSRLLFVEFEGVIHLL